jgi:hypothetical protein
MRTFDPAGDYFGELALLPGGNTRAATVRARTDVSLLVLDRPNFESLLGPLMPQLQAAAKSYTGYTPKHGIQVCVCWMLVLGPSRTAAEQHSPGPIQLCALGRHQHPWLGALL